MSTLREKLEAIKQDRERWKAEAMSLDTEQLISGGVIVDLRKGMAGMEQDKLDLITRHEKEMEDLQARLAQEQTARSAETLGLQRTVTAMEMDREKAYADHKNEVRELQSAVTDLQVETTRKGGQVVSVQEELCLARKQAESGWTDLSTARKSLRELQDTHEERVKVIQNDLDEARRDYSRAFQEVEILTTTQRTEREKAAREARLASERDMRAVQELRDSHEVAMADEKERYERLGHEYLETIKDLRGRLIDLNGSVTRADNAVRIGRDRIAVAQREKDAKIQKSAETTALLERLHTRLTKMVDDVDHLTSERNIATLRADRAEGAHRETEEKMAAMKVEAEARKAVLRRARGVAHRKLTLGGSTGLMDDLCVTPPLSKITPNIDPSGNPADSSSDGGRSSPIARKNFNSAKTPPLTKPANHPPTPTSGPRIMLKLPAKSNVHIPVLRIKRPHFAQEDLLFPNGRL